MLNEECLSLLDDLCGQSETDSEVELFLLDDDEFEESLNDINIENKVITSKLIDKWCQNNKQYSTKEFTGEYV